MEGIPSGMAAISATLLALCDAGDLIVSSRSVYGGTFALMKDFLPRKCNIKTMFVDFNDAAAVEAAVAALQAVDDAESLKM